MFFNIFFFTIFEHLYTTFETFLENCWKFMESFGTILGVRWNMFGTFLFVFETMEAVWEHV